MVGDIIREERKLAGYSQEEVADFLGIDRSTYTYYETGKIKVPLDVIERIASLFGISKTFYLGFRPQTLEFHMEDYFRMTPAQKEESDLQKEERSVTALPQTGAFPAEEDALQSLTPSERYLLAKIRILDKAGMERQVRDFLDGLLDEVPEHLE